ncbi:hypothetical protein WICMUC_005678 [Wickerhamomyces mucosus]|uniref:DNA helicase n=1 Tax=Wickerhamomyces mucosus TaxID=1378264 RepID=A0A9P8T5T8_9ASCO|nr:hypothetical protein WICMUC_005678 [Wickerhamomyces mucosus]
MSSELKQNKCILQKCIEKVKTRLHTMTNRDKDGDSAVMESDSFVNENDQLENLGVKLVEQTSLEHKIQANANKLLNKKEIETDQKRLEKSKQSLNKVKYEIRKLNDRLNNSRTRISEKESLKKQIQVMKETLLIPNEQDIKDIEDRIKSNQELSNDHSSNINDDGRLPNETEKDFLIRTGKITAFGNSTGFILEEDDRHKEPEEAISHQNLRVPGFVEETETIKQKREHEDFEEYEDSEGYDNFSDYGDSDEDKHAGKRIKLLTEDEIRNTDDGVESFYQSRLATWVHRRSKLRGKAQIQDPSIPEWFRPHPNNPDASLNNEFKIPGDIYPSLFDYQKTGVQWLFELYSQKHGGIVSDEMGLGKTIQIISFIAGLHYSKKLEGKPVLIVCPATVMTQWVNEFHTWWPPLRTMVLHSIGSGMSSKSKKSISEDDEFDDLLEGEGEVDGGSSSSKFEKLKSSNAAEIVKTLIEKGHVIITSYVGLRIYEEYLLDIDWGYAVLDEGHKIKNPNSNITILSKRLKTVNRIILSGTPIQNNLVELWSLFDFIFPGRLGTLPVFEEEFENPIKIGGYANASNLEVKVGYQKAVILKDLIQPFLLRRMKLDVARDLPSKQEYVLMCKLTKYQKEKYLQFLRSTEFKIYSYLAAINTLRKICNHPDLADMKFKESQFGYGDPTRSGKLQVIKSLLKLWKEQKHKVLLFTQTKQMMVILEKFLQTEYGPDYKYMKMSGETNIGKRQDMIYQFNNKDYDLFLLTTKVGGLGVNLTGADRVIIFDPDWNPSTDLQARERAWRLGQKKEVLIYRLVIGGSIEEKIYHRQIFKQLLTDKILKDPNQKRFFKNSELHDLFTLSDYDDSNEEDLLFKNNKGKKKQTDDLDTFSQIQGISKLEKYKGETKIKQEDSLMSGLFKGNVKALKHDDIYQDHSKPKDNHSDHLEREAKKAADNALEALKRSRKQVKKAGVGVPTFTGKFGLAGKTKVGGIKSRSSNSNSSSFFILNNLKNRSSTPEVSDSSNTEMIKQFTEYLAKQEGGFGKSKDVLKGCKVDIKTDKDLALVRSLLKSIANWDSSRSGWILNEEFR